MGKRFNIKLLFGTLAIVAFIFLCLSMFTINLNSRSMTPEIQQEPLLYPSEYDECPRDFLIPKCDVQIWRYLREMEFMCNCDKYNCSLCIPPHSSNEELNNLYQLWYNETYMTQKIQRQKLLLDLLQNNDLQSGHEHDPIILIVFNYGFAYLFLNWVCSLDYNHLSHLRRNSLIVVSDTKSKNLATKYGFEAVFDLNKVVINTTKLQITQIASKAFPEGTFKPLVTFQMIVLTDLIEMGYDVLMMDIDIIFQNDPLKYIKYNLYNWVDIWTMLAPRYDSLGFSNTGFIIMKSNCKTKTFMQTMMKYITSIYEATDQQAWNFWLFWKPFRQIIFKLLDRDMFIGGNDIRLGYTFPKHIVRYDDFILFHAYSTRDHFDKIYKFHQIGHWYFTKERCPLLFNETMIPDVSNRVEDKVQAESSGWLLKHGLITDKLKIYNATG
eukprot:65025_1